MIISEPAVDKATGMSHGMRRVGDIEIESFENAVPPFVEAALQHLYGNVFSTLAHRRVYGSARNLNTFVARSKKALICVWLFERDGRTIHVLNEGMAVNGADVMLFAQYMFAVYPNVGAITFHAVRLAIQNLELPHQRHNCLEDTVLKLPASGVDYLAQMGKSTRSYVHRYMNKLRRDHPSVRFALLEAHEIDECHIRHIIEMNRARMARKGKVSKNDDVTCEQIAHLAMDCGLVGTLTIDGRVVAGSINYCVRDNYFLEVIAHDPTYDEYRLGTLCCYLTICECILRGGDEYHFLWGQDDYKSRLLGERRDLEDLVVYRSNLQMLLHPGTALRHNWNAAMRRARLHSRALRKGNGFMARCVNALVSLRRRLHSG